MHHPRYGLRRGLMTCAENRFRPRVTCSQPRQSYPPASKKVVAWSTTSSSVRPLIDRGEPETPSSRASSKRSSSVSAVDDGRAAFCWTSPFSAVAAAATAARKARRSCTSRRLRERISATRAACFLFPGVGKRLQPTPKNRLYCCKAARNWITESRTRNERRNRHCSSRAVFNAA